MKIAAIIGVPLQECHKKDIDIDLEPGLQARLGITGGALSSSFKCPPVCHAIFCAIDGSHEQGCLSLP